MTPAEELERLLPFEIAYGYWAVGEPRGDKVRMFTRYLAGS